MANEKISELTDIGTSAVTIDALAIVDNSVGETKKVLLHNLHYGFFERENIW